MNDREVLLAKINVNILKSHYPYSRLPNVPVLTIVQQKQFFSLFDLETPISHLHTKK